MKPERASNLRHRLIIEKKSITKGPSGEDEVDWEEYVTTWAAIVQKPRGGMYGREFQVADQTLDETYVRIRCRYRSGVTADMRGRFVDREGNSKHYKFHAVTDVQERGRMLEIDAVLVKESDFA